MNRQDNRPETIVAPNSTKVGIRSNVRVSSNVYQRRTDINQPSEDVAFRCRVRGAVALHDVVPPGVIDYVSNRHDIQKISESDREAAFDGELPHTAFALLPEQIIELSAFRCIYCGRSTVSVWFEGGKVRQQFAECLCQREAKEVMP